MSADDVPPTTTAPNPHAPTQAPGPTTAPPTHPQAPTTARPTHPQASTTASVTSQELDLAFCCDCTGSMGAYIRSAQDNIREIASSIHARLGQKSAIRYALVKYRDHPPQDRTFVTEVFPFTDNLELLKRNIDTMAASGGGDGPEAVTAALHELNQLPWRPNATKVAVLIADAPPHGLGENGDGFPNGCPLGYDPVKICKELSAKSVVVYAVGVEPVLSTSYKFARDFMLMVATITDGRFLPLGKASILSDVVVNGAVEGCMMNELWAKLELETKQEAEAQGVQLKEAEVVAKTQERLKEAAKHVALAQVDVANPYMENYDRKNAKAMINATSLAEARSKLDGNANAHVAQASAGYAWGAQEALCSAAPVVQKQQNRMAKRALKTKGAWDYECDDALE